MSANAVVPRHGRGWSPSFPSARRSSERHGGRSGDHGKRDTGRWWWVCPRRKQTDWIPAGLAGLFIQMAGLRRERLQCYCGSSRLLHLSANPIQWKLVEIQSLSAPGFRSALTSWGFRAPLLSRITGTQGHAVSHSRRRGYRRCELSA